MYILRDEYSLPPYLPLKSTQGEKLHGLEQSYINFLTESSSRQPKTKNNVKVTQIMLLTV